MRGCVPYRIFSTTFQLGAAQNQAFDGLDLVNLQHMYFAFMELRTDLEKLHWYGVLNDTVLRMVIRYVQSKPDGEIFDQAISRLRSATMSVQIECQKELETLNCIIDLVAGRLKESMVQAGTSNLASSVEILQSEIELN